jgi:hypothetical protein
MRAIVPLPKGTEVLFNYNPTLIDRAKRREQLAKRYGFVCQCELCALPDDLSNALDVKIKQAKDAYSYVDRFFDGEEDDAIRALRLLDTYVSFTIREGLYFNYSTLFLPVKIFVRMKDPDVLRRVGNAIHRLFHRHVGSGSSGNGNASVAYMSSILESSVRGLDQIKEVEALLPAEEKDRRLDAQLRQTAESIISSLQSLP